jgi:hypothetical protein
MGQCSNVPWDDQDCPPTAILNHDPYYDSMCWFKHGMKNNAGVSTWPQPPICPQGGVAGAPALPIDAYMCLNAQGQYTGWYSAKLSSDVGYANGMNWVVGVCGGVAGQLPPMCLQPASVKAV